MKDKTEVTTENTKKMGELGITLNLIIIVFTSLIIVSNFITVFEEFVFLRYYEENGLDIYDPRLTDYVLEYGGLSLGLLETKLHGNSMRPTLAGNEVALCDSEPKLSKIKINDFVAYKKEWEDKNALKRVVGVAGDEIKLDDKGLWRNGELIDEPYARYEDELNKFPEHDERTLVIPENHVYALGDNRNNSIDSRVDGPINLETEIYCKYIYTMDTYEPKDKEDGFFK